MYFSNYFRRKLSISELNVDVDFNIIESIIIYRVRQVSRIAKK